jgi:hypothetical protein
MRHNKRSEYATAVRFNIGIIIFSLIGIALLFCLGCKGLSPLIKPQPIHVAIPAYTDYRPVLCFEIGKEVNVKPTPTPNPDPSPNGPKVGDTCKTCNGTGKSGDKINPCFQCGADGKLDEGDPGLLLTDKLPDLATPLISSKLLAPINIIVKKEPTVKETKIYWVEYNGQVYMWNEAKRMFIGILGTGFKYEDNEDIDKVQSVTLCTGNTCTQVPVQHSIARTQNEPRADQRPSN